MPQHDSDGRRTAGGGKNCGIVFPAGYKMFLQNFGNGGFYLFGVEPMMGVGQSVTPSLSDYRNSCRLLLEEREEKEVFIFPWNQTVPMRCLVPFTYGAALELSNDHWVFICDGTENEGNYAVGYLSQSAGDIICVLDSFEKWLDIFWEGNRERESEYLPVIHLLYEDYQQRMDLLEADHEELKALFERIYENEI